MVQKRSKVHSVGLILTGLLLGAVTIAPAFAYHTPAHSKKQIAKVKKSLNKKIGKLPTTSAVQQAIDASIADVTEPNAFVFAHDGFIDLPTTETTLGQLILPAGRYMVQAKLVAVPSGAVEQKITCDLRFGDGHDQALLSSTAESGLSLAVLSLVTFAESSLAGAPARLSCITDDFGAGTSDSFAYYVKLVAMTVSSITDQSI